MLESQKISDIVSQVVQANTSPTSVLDVKAEPAMDWAGEEEVLRITIVITPEAVSQLAAGRALDTLVQIRDRLGEAGEHRFPILEYATERELVDIDDT